MNDKQIEHLSKVRQIARDVNAKKRELSLAQQDMALAFVIGSQLGISGSDLSRAADVSRQRVSQILQQGSQID
jgi:DNA-binding MarR family transcriptional regulator